MIRYALMGVAALGVGYGISYGVIAAGSRPAPPKPAPVAAPAAPVTSNTSTKGDRLVVMQSDPRLAEALAAKAARMLAPPVAVAAPAPIAEEEEERPRSRRHARRQARSGRDVCARHHMHKVSIRGGRSWRCRR
jgi:hypothetical protein